MPAGAAQPHSTATSSKQRKPCRRIGDASFEFHLDAIVQHRDGADLVGLAADGQLFGLEGVQRLVAQQFLRDHAADLLQPLGIAAADALQLDALGARLVEPQRPRGDVVAATRC